MLAATDYPLLNIFWTMLLLFLWIAWIWILFTIIIDLFRRDDIGGVAKALWLIFLIVVPFFGVLVYVIAEGNKMTERRVTEQHATQQQFDQYVQGVASSSGASAEIEKAKQLLDSGAITADEYEQIKRKALAS
jgi:predicted PurR-regulated permease PerM